MVCMNELVKLVNAFAQYEDEQAHLTAEDFCKKYLADHVRKVRHESDNYGMSQQTQLLGLVIRLNKFASVYAKKALKKINFNSEDWFYLISLIDGSTPKKSELIHQHLSEFPSGIEIIKRLLKGGFIEEIPDETDKRSKRVKITPTGIQILVESLDDMNQIGPMAFSTMSATEMEMVSNLLKRLDNFHEGHIKTIRDSSFEEACEILIQQ